MKKFYCLLAILSLYSCQKEGQGSDTPEPAPRCYSLTVSSEVSFRWKSGARICANGYVSDPLAPEYDGRDTVVFTFNENHLPAGSYNVCYPESVWADSTSLEFPDSVNVSSPIPMAGYSNGTGPVCLKQLCSYLEIPLEGQSGVRFLDLFSNGGEQLSGRFRYDYRTSELAPDPEPGNARERVRSSSNLVLLPAGTYSSGFAVRLVNESDQYLKGRDDTPVTVACGEKTRMNRCQFAAGGDYFQISDARQWNGFAESFNNNGVRNVSSTLADITADLDFENVELIPLGLRSNSTLFYCGELDGNGHSIRNAALTLPVISATGDGAYVHDLRIESSCQLEADYSAGRYEFGPFIGYMKYGKIQNCRNDANVVLKSLGGLSYSDLYLGGIAGRVEVGHIHDCVNAGGIVCDAGYVSSSKNIYAGGIAGANVISNGSFKQCSNYGSIQIGSSALHLYVGGITAYTKSYIKSSANYGGITVDSPSETVVGGIAGVVDARGFNLSDNNCVESAAICLKSCSGAICGGQYGTVNEAMTLKFSGDSLFADGEIRVVPAPGASELVVGGLIGRVGAKITLEAGSDAVIDSDISIDFPEGGLTNPEAGVCVGGFVGNATGLLNVSGAYDSQFRFRGNVNLKSGSAPLSVKDFYVGGILGLASAGANLTHCHADSPSGQRIGGAEGSVSASGGAVGGVSALGGIAGRIEGDVATLWTCTCTADVVSGCNCTSGILGVADCDGLVDMSSCNYRGKIRAAYGIAAALAASAENVAVSNSSVSADIEAPSAGGIFGSCRNSKIGSDGVCILNGTINGTAITEANVKTLSCASGTASPNRVTTGIGCRRVSILGDSISTHADAIPSDCRPYYPGAGAANLTVSQTYWYKLIYDKLPSAVLEQNVSYSGCCLSRNSDDVHPCFLSWYDRYGVGAADIVLIHGGTNDKTQEVDNCAGVAYNVVPTEAQFAEIFATQIKDLDDSKFVPAYYKLCSQILGDHPGVRIVCIIGDYLSSAQEKCIIRMADEFPDNVRYVDFYGDRNITKASSCHPDANGMAYMADRIYEQVGTWLLGQ